MEDFQQKEINILDYLYLIVRARRFIVTNLVGISIIAAIVSLLLPVTYRGEAVMLPPVEQKRAFGFSDVLASIPVTTLRLGTTGSPAEIYQGILRSSSVRRAVVERFNLLEVYNVDTEDDAMEALKNNTEIGLTKEGLIRVRVEDRDRVRCANIANFYIYLLDRTNQRINQRTAVDRLTFLEKQIGAASEALAEAERKLISFQQATNAISIYHQQRVAISVAAELEMDIMNTEMRVKELLSKSYTMDHPQISNLMKRIDFREDQLAEMRFGRRVGGPIERESLFVPIVKAPVMTLQYARYEREVEVIGILLQLLSQHASESKIETENTTLTVSLLDEAYPPDLKYKPRRKLIVLLSAAFALFFSMVIIITVEYTHRLAESSTIDRERIDRLVRFLRLKN